MWKILRLLALTMLAASIIGCAKSDDSQASAKQAPDRDGFSGQMGVPAGDINDYGS
ncbi:MAG TPA: hypothetical protein VNI20_12685 [Fimbriimonadaceae bacterium]|nr:hypothetical protein [Fimbriimonadaceae bacterium]